VRYKKETDCLIIEPVYWEVAELNNSMLREELKEMDKTFHGMGEAKKRDILYFVRHNLTYDQMRALLRSAEGKIRESAGFIKTPCSGRDAHNCPRVFECDCGMSKNW
tara:strand:+ start:132 stop:452 length:321 start_codon:yes stop_codon:yes gene_type:complete